MSHAIRSGRSGKAAARTPRRKSGGIALRDVAKSRLVAALIPTIAGSVFRSTIQALTEELDASG